MRRRSWMLGCALALTLASGARAAGGNATLDLKASHAAFTVSHVLISRVEGSLPIRDVTLRIDPATLAPHDIIARLDARGVDTHNADRDDDLRGSEWFDAGHHPDIVFKSRTTTVESDGTFRVEGDFTLRGASHPLVLTIVAKANADRSRIVYTAVGNIDRHDYGMRATRADALVGTTVELRITATVTVREPR